MMMIIAASVQLDYIKTNWRTLAGNAAVLAEMRETGAEVNINHHRESLLTMIVTGAGEQVQPVGVRPVGVLGHGRHRQ